MLMAGHIRIGCGVTSHGKAYEMTWQPPTTGIGQAAAMADAQHAIHSHDRHLSAENLAELKAMRRAHIGPLRRLLNRVTRRPR